MMIAAFENRQAESNGELDVIDSINLSLAQIKASSELVAGVLGVNPEMEYGVSIRTAVEMIYTEAERVHEDVNAWHKEVASKRVA